MFVTSTSCVISGTVLCFGFPNYVTTHVTLVWAVSVDLTYTKLFRHTVRLSEYKIIQIVVITEVSEQ